MIEPSRVRQRPQPDSVGSFPAGTHPVVRRLLLARGARDAAAIELNMGDLLAPDSLSGIRAASELLADAVVGGKQILIVGDFDADGATGTALAVLALRAMGCETVDFRVPNRFEYGYGLTVPLVETLSDVPPDLLITVDSGISCIAGVQYARELGSDVIVTDHHLPGERIPAANAIVNPNSDDDEFPSKSLAGVGVVFYLLVVLRRVLRERGWFTGRRREPNLAQYLDLVALGTVADLVPLDHNNRVLVRQGLERIRRGVARPGLLALLRLGKRDYRFAGATDLGFAVGPRLNAAGRLEDMSTGIRCLLSENAEEAMALASELDELNRQRKDMQARMQQDAMEQVGELLSSLQRDSLPTALCLYDESWHQGVVGLVASRVKDSVHRPVLAFAPESPGADVLKGSARSVRGLHIRDVLAFVDAQQPGLMEAYGGHAMAAGLTIRCDRLSEFRTALEDAVLAILDGEELTPEIWTDGELAHDELTLETAAAIENSGPWGQRFPEPLFDGCFDVLERRIVGGSHLKMVVQSNPAAPPLDAIAFNRSSEDLPVSGRVRFLYRLGVNRWRGSESCQLMVEDMVG